MAGAGGEQGLPGDTSVPDARAGAGRGRARRRHGRAGEPFRPRHACMHARLRANCSIWLWTGQGTLDMWWFRGPSMKCVHARWRDWQASWPRHSWRCRARASRPHSPQSRARCVHRPRTHPFSVLMNGLHACACGFCCAADGKLHVLSRKQHSVAAHLLEFVCCHGLLHLCV